MLRAAIPCRIGTHLDEGTAQSRNRGMGVCWTSRGNRLSPAGPVPLPFAVRECGAASSHHEGQKLGRASWQCCGPEEFPPSLATLGQELARVAETNGLGVWLSLTRCDRTPKSSPHQWLI